MCKTLPENGTIFHLLLFVHLFQLFNSTMEIGKQIGKSNHGCATSDTKEQSIEKGNILFINQQST